MNSRKLSKSLTKLQIKQSPTSNINSNDIKKTKKIKQNKNQIKSEKLK